MSLSKSSRDKSSKLAIVIYFKDKVNEKHSKVRNFLQKFEDHVFFQNL